MRLKIKKEKISGYSIIEIVIYLAIFTTMSIVVINSFIVVVSSFSAIRTNHDLLESGSVAMERIAREIRQADDINVAVSLPGDALLLNNTDDIKFAKSGNYLYLYKGDLSNPVGNLLGQNINLTYLNFTKITTANSEAVKILMTIEDNRGKLHKAVNFYDTVVVRGGY